MRTRFEPVCELLRATQPWIASLVRNITVGVLAGFLAGIVGSKSQGKNRRPCSTWESRRASPNRQVQYLNAPGFSVDLKHQPMEVPETTGGRTGGPSHVPPCKKRWPLSPG